MTPRKGKYAPKSPRSYRGKPGHEAGGGHPTTSETVYTDDETEFLRAIEQYRRENRRPFPTYAEVLAVLRSLGYRRVAEPGPTPRRR